MPDSGADRLAVCPRPLRCGTLSGAALAAAGAVSAPAEAAVHDRSELLQGQHRVAVLVGGVEQC